jgi:hypothetical protein
LIVTLRRRSAGPSGRDHDHAYFPDTQRMYRRDIVGV